MANVDFFPDKDDDDRNLHIETYGVVINIRVNLTNIDGKQVTNISIRHDDQRGEEWHIPEFVKQESHIGILVVEGKANAK